MLRQLVLMAFLLGTSLVSFAFTEVIEYEFTATGINYFTVGDPVSLPTELTDVSSVSGSFSLDTSVPNEYLDRDDPTIGSFPASILAMDVNYDTGFYASGEFGSLHQSRFAINNSILAHWSFGEFSTLSTTLNTSLNLVAINFSVADHDTGGQYLGSDMRYMITDLSGFPNYDGLKRVELVFQNATSTVYASSYLQTLNQVNAVPEPTTAVSTALGLLMMCFRRRKVRI